MAETAVSDGKGRIYVNIEDQHEIIADGYYTTQNNDRWSLKLLKVRPDWLDLKRNRLFAGCDKMLVVMDAVLESNDRVSIPDGCDGVML
jgi:hypothetical protein